MCSTEAKQTGVLLCEFIRTTEIIIIARTGQMCARSFGTEHAARCKSFQFGFADIIDVASV